MSGALIVFEQKHRTNDEKNSITIRPRCKRSSQRIFAVNYLHHAFKNTISHIGRG